MQKTGTSRKELSFSMETLERYRSKCARELEATLNSRTRTNYTQNLAPYTSSPDAIKIVRQNTPPSTLVAVPSGAYSAAAATAATAATATVTAVEADIISATELLAKYKLDDNVAASTVKTSTDDSDTVVTKSQTTTGRYVNWAKTIVSHSDDAIKVDKTKSQTSVAVKSMTTRSTANDAAAAAAVADEDVKDVRPNSYNSTKVAEPAPKQPTQASGCYINWSSNHTTLSLHPWCAMSDLIYFCDKYEFKSLSARDTRTQQQIVAEVRAILASKAPFGQRTRFPTDIRDPENLWVCIGRCAGVEYHLSRILTAFRKPLDQLLPEKQRVVRQNFHLAVAELRLDISARISEVRLYDRQVFEREFRLEWKDEA